MGVSLLLLSIPHLLHHLPLLRDRTHRITDAPLLSRLRRRTRGTGRQTTTAAASLQSEVVKVYKVMGCTDKRHWRVVQSGGIVNMENGKRVGATVRAPQRQAASTSRRPLRIIRGSGGSQRVAALLRGWLSTGQQAAGLAARLRVFVCVCVCVCLCVCVCVGGWVWVGGWVGKTPWANSSKWHSHSQPGVGGQPKRVSQRRHQSNGHRHQAAPAAGGAALFLLFVVLPSVNHGAFLRKQYIT